MPVKVKIIKRFGSWAVTNFGLDHLGRPRYEIDKDQLLSTDWVTHMGDKNWVNKTSFKAAYNAAIEYHYHRKAA